MSCARQACAAPMTPQVMPYRACVRHDNGPLSPFTSGSRFASGTTTLSKNSAEVTEARSENLRSISGAAALAAARHVRQPALFLRLAAQGVDRVHAQRALHRDETADAGVAALELLADQAVRDGVQAGAVVTVDR